MWVCICLSRPKSKFKKNPQETSSSLLLKLILALEFWLWGTSWTLAWVKTHIKCCNLMFKPPVIWKKGIKVRILQNYLSCFCPDHEYTFWDIKGTVSPKWNRLVSRSALLLERWVKFLTPQKYFEWQRSAALQPDTIQLKSRVQSGPVCTRSEHRHIYIFVFSAAYLSFFLPTVSSHSFTHTAASVP